jgi:alkane 1-monooxygenase
MVAAGVAGFVMGGGWVWLGAATFPALTALDLVFSRPDHAVRRVRYPRLAEVPLYLHAVLMVALLAAAAWRAHAGEAGAPLAAGRIAGVVASLAWLSVVPNIPFVHELIHRQSRLDRFLGFVLAVVVADPMRRLAHLRGHHALLGLREDSDTARRGETIYGFMVRAACRAARESFLSEKSRLAKRGLSVWSFRGDAIRSMLLTASVLAAIGLAAGTAAALTTLAAFLASRFLLESFNYLQHYGLVRAPGTPFGHRHSWNHLSPVVRAAALEITNHAHHHRNPTVPFHALVPEPEAPQMPSALLCFLCALVPPLWERLIVMPRLRDWDFRYATPQEREIAAADNAAAGWPNWLAEAPSALHRVDAEA